MYYFSPATRGFYRSDIHGENIPEDVKELTDAQYQALMPDAKPNTVILSDADGWPQRVEIALDEPASERDWRNSELLRFDWVVARHREERELNVKSTLSDEEFVLLLHLRQQLRDWPTTAGFPKITHRPCPTPLLAKLLKPNR